MAKAAGVVLMLVPRIDPARRSRWISRVDVPAILLRRNSPWRIVGGSVILDRSGS